MQRFGRGPDGRPPAVELPERAVRSGGVAALGTARCLWVAVGSEVVRVGISGPWRVVAVPDGLVAWCGSADALIGPGLDLQTDQRVRRGRDLVVCREPGGPWSVEGHSLPEGPRWARDLRPWPEGRGLTWSDSGWQYRWDLVSPARAVGRASAWPPPPEPVPDLELPDDVVRGAAQVGGLRVIATRVEGGAVVGWLRDGCRVFDQPSSGNS